MPQIDIELVEVPVSEVCPTQMTVGFAEVDRKREEIARMGSRKDDSRRLKFINEAFFPGVRGPEEKYYIIDHHHWALAILKEGGTTIQVGVMDDLRVLSQEEFWVFMDHRTWVHSYDQNGRRRPFKEMPESLTQLSDDPYRSLATEVRRRGGFPELDMPYLEFLWANFLRLALPRGHAKGWSEKAIKKACALCKSERANYLPGWAGDS